MLEMLDFVDDLMLKKVKQFLINQYCSLIDPVKGMINYLINLMLKRVK